MSTLHCLRPSKSCAGACPGSSPWTLLTAAIGLSAALGTSSAVAQGRPGTGAPVVTQGIVAPVPSNPPAAAPTSGLAQQDIRGMVKARQYTTLAAEIGALVKSMTLPEGGRFSKGALLVQLDCSLHAAQASKAEAELSAARRTLQANQRLTELEAAGKMELDLAQSSVERAEAELKMSQAQLSKCTIVAPFRGVIAESRIREQQYAQPGQPLLDIIDDSSFELEFLAPSTWLERLKSGQKIQLTVDELQRNYSARLLRVSPRIDPVSQSIKVTAVLEGTLSDLKSGMSGRVQLP